MAEARSKSQRRRSKAASPSLPSVGRAFLVGLLTRRRMLRLLAALLCAAAVALALSFARRPAANLLAQRELVRARSLLAAGHSEEAGATLRKALRWNPALAEARGLLGGLELERGRLEPAFLEFQSLSELQPRNADGWFGLAHVRERAAQPEEAEAAMDQVLELVPERSGARTLRSELRYRVGRYQGAYLDAERAVKANPKDARAGWSWFAPRLRVKGLLLRSAPRKKASPPPAGTAALVQELASRRAGPSPAAPGGPRLREGFD